MTLFQLSDSKKLLLLCLDFWDSFVWTRDIILFGDNTRILGFDLLFCYGCSPPFEKSIFEKFRFRGLILVQVFTGFHPLALTYSCKSQVIQRHLNKNTSEDAFLLTKVIFKNRLLHQVSLLNAL